jgi:transcriptional regulator with XRE-family HTH domain
MNLIEKYRTQAGLNQTQLAKKAGLTQAAISQYEAQERQPNGRSLCRIAKVLNIAPEALANIENEEETIAFDDATAIARVGVILNWWEVNGETALALEKLAQRRMGTAREDPLAWLLTRLTDHS